MLKNQWFLFITSLCPGNYVFAVSGSCSYCDSTGLLPDYLQVKHCSGFEFEFWQSNNSILDILIVTELDRLGRNKYDTMQQIQRIKNMGVRLMVLELPTTLMDLSVMDNAMARMMLETINNMMLELYASMAQAELEKKEKRQREGIEAKKLRGEWDDYGRPSVMKQETFDENFQSVVSGETTPTQLRKNLGMTHSTFYRYRKTFYEKYPELSNSAN